MKTLLFLLISMPLIAQVGVNTTNPQATLHVAGDAIVETTPVSSSNDFLVKDPDDRIGMRTIERQSYIIDATEPRDYTVSNPNTSSALIPLDMSQAISIPANTTAKVFLEYNVPMGLATNTTNVDAYMGVRLLQNNQSISQANRKQNLGAINDNGGQMSFPCTFVAGKRTVVITNTTASAMSVNFALWGYVEQASADTSVDDTIYRFKMWSATGNNYNWGKACMTIDVIIE